MRAQSFLVLTGPFPGCGGQGTAGDISPSPGSGPWAHSQWPLGRCLVSVCRVGAGLAGQRTGLPAPCPPAGRCLPWALWLDAACPVPSGWVLSALCPPTGRCLPRALGLGTAVPGPLCGPQRQAHAEADGGRAVGLLGKRHEPVADVSPPGAASVAPCRAWRMRGNVADDPKGMEITEGPAFSLVVIMGADTGHWHEALSALLSGHSEKELSLSIENRAAGLCPLPSVGPPNGSSGSHPTSSWPCPLPVQGGLALAVSRCHRRILRGWPVSCE